MTGTPSPTVWPSIRYHDARRAVTFLVEVFGFHASLVVEGDGPGSRPIQHAQLRWPEGGGIMLGSLDPGDRPYARATPSTGVAACYVVTDAVDAVHARVQAAGAEIIEPLQDDGHAPGSRSFTALDPEGNVWTFGNYRGE